MTKRLKLFVLATLGWGILSGPAAMAQDHAHMDSAPEAAAPVAMKQVRWSDPAAWPSGKVPAAGEAVTIPRDMAVTLDVTPPALRSLTIQGKLTFADERDLALTTEWIYIPGGELAIGSEAKPFTHKASITLTDNVRGEDINTMGDRGIVMMRGTLNLHGDRDHTWTKLASTALAGASRIDVLDARQWRKGDEIVLASTDFDPRQAERRTITAIKGNTITLDKPLQYMHYGEITFGVDERGEVGLLTRNIKIQASEDSNENYFGGHIMGMPGSKIYVSGVELSRMGQHMHLARYPIHWHLIGEGAGQYIKNAAIHDTFSRCVTVHGTNNLRVENNVTFNTVGHCFFMEDAVEHGNQFVRNLGIQTKCHPTLPCQPTNLAIAHQSTEGQRAKNILIPSDNTAATFWITNPNNTYRDNVAAGSDSIGFWIALPQHPTGQFEGTELSKATWPRRLPIGEFKGNTAHSNFDGLMFDRGPNPEGFFTVGGAGHITYADPADTKSERLPAVIEDFAAYKNRNGGIWGRGEYHLFRNLKLADNAIGFTHASGGAGLAPYTSRVENSLFVGESGNIGNPVTPAELAYGRSLPKIEDPDFPIRGYEYYDYLHEVANNTFVNYVPNELRDAGAMSYLLFTSFGMSTHNSVEGAKFINAKPVDFPPVQRRWASDFGGRAAYRSAAFQDRDGSVGGIPGAYIVINNGIASDETNCKIMASWNAAVCTGDMGRLSIGDTKLFPEFVAPSTDPIVLERNGIRFEYNGETTLPSGAQIKVVTGRNDLALHLREMDKGAWVIFELPGFSAPDTGKEVASMDALRASPVTAWFKDKGSLWTKLVVEDPTPDGPVVVQVGQLKAQASLEVNREGLGG